MIKYMKQDMMKQLIRIVEIFIQVLEKIVLMRSPYIFPSLEEAQGHVIKKVDIFKSKIITVEVIMN